jgi:hypothetical protein
MERADRRADRRDYSVLFVRGLLVPLGLLRADVTRARSVIPHLQQAGAHTESRVNQLEFLRLRISPSFESAIPQFATMDLEIVSRAYGVISLAQSFNGMVDSALERAGIDINGFEKIRADLVTKIVKGMDRLEYALVEFLGLPGDKAKPTTPVAADSTD